MLKTFACEQCQKEFQSYQDGRFCSRDCWRNYVSSHPSPKNQQIQLTCPICLSTFYVKPSHSAGRICCSIDCNSIYRSRQRQTEIAKKFNKPIFALLFDLYYLQELGIKQIAQKLGVSDRNLWDWFEELGIDRRSRTDAIKLQWANNQERRIKQSERTKQAYDSEKFDRFRIVRIAKTDWARKRNSESKMGNNNPMAKRPGPLNPNWKGGKIYYYGPSWYRQRVKARERDNFTCQRCGITESQLGKQLDVHHKIKFRHFGIKRHKEANDLNNLICLCPNCHVREESDD